MVRKMEGDIKTFFIAIDYSIPHVAASGNVCDARTSRVLK